MTSNRGTRFFNSREKSGLSDFTHRLSSIDTDRIRRELTSAGIRAYGESRIFVRNNYGKIIVGGLLLATAGYIGKLLATNKVLRKALVKGIQKAPKAVMVKRTFFN